MNYYQALHKLFGGEFGPDSYRVSNALVRIRMDNYQVDPGMEIVVNESWTDRALQVERSPDGIMDYVHINLAVEGSVNQSFENKDVTMAASSMQGAFIYNGLFPMSIHFPARQDYRTISIKIQSETMAALLPESLDQYRKMFEDPQGIGYHISIPGDLENLCREIIHYRDSGFGNRAMVISRGIQALVYVFKIFRTLAEEKQLRGLHPDDFERMHAVKDLILSRLDEVASMEELSREFGISVSKLKRDFKSLFDCSVYQFYTRARMDEAYRRLKSGQYSVMEVGYDLGYKNLSKFSEMFKKIKGISPSEVS